MKQETKNRICLSIRDFRLPRYSEIPNVGLYLEQVTKYICEYLAPIQDNAITGSMISNYVKRGLVKNPVRKLYDREQIAYLLFIAVAKSVLSLEDIQLLIRVQQKSYTPEVAYNYFCCELENILQVVFGLKDTLDEVGVDHTEEKTMLRNTIITAAHKVYLDKSLNKVREIL